MKKVKRKIISLPPNYFYACIVLTILTIFIPNVKTIISYPYNLLGILIMILGFYLISITYLQFSKSKTPESFEKSKCVVTTGLYKYSRNPMYIGSIIFLIGLSILIKTLIGFVFPIALFLILNYMFIPFEEEKMEKELGKKYLKYKKTVRRWI